MNDFHQRWNELVARAKAIPGSAAPDDTSPPAGFATRILALAREAGAIPSPEVDWEAYWLRRARQSLALAFVVAVVMVGLDLRQRSRPALGHPGIENTVAQLLWQL